MWYSRPRLSSGRATAEGGCPTSESGLAIWRVVVFFREPLCFPPAGLTKGLTGVMTSYLEEQRFLTPYSSLPRPCISALLV